MTTVLILIKVLALFLAIAITGVISVAMGAIMAIAFSFMIEKLINNGKAKFILYILSFAVIFGSVSTFSGLIWMRLIKYLLK